MVEFEKSLQVSFSLRSILSSSVDFDLFWKTNKRRGLGRKVWYGKSGKILYLRSEKKA